MQKVFELELYGLGEDKATVEIIEREDKGPFIKFCVHQMDVPDFVLYGKDLKSFLSVLNGITGDEPSVATGDDSSTGAD